MIKIIPAIIAKDFQELQNKVKKVEPYVDWVQFDIMDGEFVDNITWKTQADLKELKTNLKLEAHLLIKNPELIIDDWISSGIDRIIFHYSSTKKHQEIIKKIKKAGLKIGLAINPETHIKVVDTFIKQLDLITVMTVNPGWSGQGFLQEHLEKIRQLREKYQEIDIEVDGGINLETGPMAIEAGANILAVGSAIFKSGNIKKTIEDLKNDH